MVLVCHVIPQKQVSKGHVTLWEGKHPLMVSHHLAKFSDHRHDGS